MTPYSKKVLDQYRHIPTATITTVLLKKGIKNTWIRGAFPLTEDQPRVAGPAFTLRFVPAREDLATPESWSAPISTRSAIEAMPEGCIAVVAADGCTDAGVFGDILCQRMKYRNVAAMLTDGVVRDLDGGLQTGLNTWAKGVAAPASVASLTFVNWQEPIGCGGVAIFPNDLIVADRDGAVVVPQLMVEEVLKAAIKQEELEEWIMSEVKMGASLLGLYPPNEQNMRRFEDQQKA